MPPLRVVVVGSLNMDLIVTVPHLPQPGETVTGDNFFRAAGGKGANQAVAAARLFMTLNAPPMGTSMRVPRHV